MELATPTNDSTPKNMHLEKKVIKAKPVEKSKSLKTNVLKKLDLETVKLLTAIKEKVNKKSIGRNIKDSEVLNLSLRQLTDDHISQLRQQTYTEKDQLALAHDEYQQKNGKISLEQFIGKLLSGEYVKNKI